MVRLDAARAAHESLAERGVVVRCFDQPDTPLAGCLRVTVGTPEENNWLLDALSAILRSK
jgi:histidinol-phosphate aminotransferase